MPALLCFSNELKVDKMDSYIKAQTGEMPGWYRL